MSISPDYEASVLETFADMVSKKLVYRSGRPTLWSSKEQRVLAEEEIEEKTAMGPTYLVKFKVKHFGKGSSDLAKLGNVTLIGFVKEPWRLIATQGLAVNPNIRYGLVKNKDRDYFIIALDRVGEIGIRLDRNNFETQFEAPGTALYDMTIQHPLFSDRDLTVVPDDSISSSFGSGINIVSPMSCLHDLDLAEQYYLNTEGFISKSGKFTGDLGNEFEHLNPYTEGNELVTELMDVHQ